ncbi:hypothetical protein PG991_003181 [Apiospora marii]|uniref:U6 small nuclear RNA (adenine-(43)-N(6))-methyltransferase n=1 Tax=Apiospora marii TaxID=335849 RepID=A0ABR1SJU5_9PEZI
MASPSNDPSVPRGLKRKHDGNAPRLTPSQRLAAARRAGIETSVDPTELGIDDLTKKTVAEPVASSDADNDGKENATSPMKKKARQDEGCYERLYASELDFEALGKEDGDFGALLTAGRHLDFTDPAAMMQLTKTLLKRDFDLQVELPDDRLCPPVPNRHNYILWLKSLLDTTSSTYADAYEPEREVMGLDVGTGASAVYPLLGCAQRPSWSFIATDIDAKSLSCARRNVALNGLESRIRVLARDDSSASLIPDLDELDTPQLDFVMTNPPFYESEAELRDLAAQKALPPASACTGAPHEMVCEGGEVGFIQRLLDESLVLRERVQWYTAMVGKQSSLGIVVDRLRCQGVDNYAVAQFVQGHKTRRWAVGWSLGARRPAVRACRGGGLVGGLTDGNGKSLLPQVTEMTVASRTVRTPTAASQLENTFWTQLEDVTDGLDLVAWSLDEERLRGVGFTDGNVWGRAYRRQKRRAAAPMENGEEGKGDDGGKKEEEGQEKEKGKSGDAIGDRTKSKKEPAECPFGFSISIQTRGKQNTEGATVQEVAAVVRWLQGSDVGLFESFCGMLRNGFVAVTTG